MKTNTYKNIVLIAALLAAGCKQDVINLTEPGTITPATPSKGTADFTKYVAVGNSLTSGYQAGALFTAGQENSFPLIMSKSFQSVGGSATFNQPDINSVNGFYAYDPVHSIFLGRLILFAADGNPADALPTPSGSPGVPAPYNTADPIGPYSGDKSKLNNFGVPGILLGQALTPLTGGPATGNPAFNPYYARFASNPGTSTIIGDAIAAQPTFFSFDLGNNDVLGYATSGGDASIVPLTDPGAFQTEYTGAIGALLNPTTNQNNPQGVVSTIPNVAVLPYFHAVAWNAIPLDTATASVITTNLANLYNGFLQQLVLGKALSATEAAQRTLKFKTGQNPILIVDTDLTNLAPYMQGPAAGLLPYAQARQTTSNDLITLSAGGILGTLADASPTDIYGVSVPLADKYVLVPSEIDSIETYTAAFNTAIAAVAAQFKGKIAVADVNAAFTSLAANGAYVSDGVTVTDSFAPPLGGFSEDGVHPNSRGYAYLANIFIAAIETTFGATIPHASLAAYAPVGLPQVPVGK